MLRGATVAMLLTSACAVDAAKVGRAADRAEPHLAAFADFDGWARRARASAAGHRRESLVETSFAPLRLERAVLGAWIAVDGGHPALLSWPVHLTAPEGLAWVTLRDRELGSVSVHASARCSVQPERRRKGSTPVGACVLLSRTAPTMAGRPMTVTVAFKAPGADEIASTARRPR